MPLTKHMTEEQLELLTLTADNAARKAAKHTLRRWRNAAVVGYAVLMAGVALSLYDSNQQGNNARDAIVGSGRAVAVDGCNRDFVTIGILRNQLQSSLRTLPTYVADGTITQKQYRVSVKETKALLKRYTQPDCRQADRLLTADPERHVPNIKPMYLHKGKKG